MRRTTKTEIFPNVLGRLSLCVMKEGKYRNNSLLRTSPIGVPLHFPSPSRRRLGSGSESTSFRQQAFKHASPSGALMISSLHVQCSACRAMRLQLCSGRSKLEVCSSASSFNAVTAFHLERLTCNITSSMSFGSMPGSAVSSSSSASSTAGWAALPVPPVRLQDCVKCSAADAWHRALRPSIFYLPKTT